MKEAIEDNLEIAPTGVVLQAARNFAAALAESPQFKAFEEASQRLNRDQAAQAAIKAFQEQQQAWQALIMLNALNAEQKAYLDSLKDSLMNQATVQNYLSAQNELATLCQYLGDQLSDALGLNYASACGVSCCG